MRVKPWLPPILWMGVIFWLSTGAFSDEATGRWLLPVLRLFLPRASAAQLDFLHAAVRKAGHVAEYAILAWLWYRAFLRSGRGPRPLAAFAFTLAYAGLDELHQAWTGLRGGSLLDVALDAFGGGAALAPARWGWRRVAERLTTALLWFAAAGGTLLLAVSLFADRPPGGLRASVPLAWLALWAWRRWGRGR